MWTLLWKNKAKFASNVKRRTILTAITIMTTIITVYWFIITVYLSHPRNGMEGSVAEWLWRQTWNPQVAAIKYRNYLKILWWIYFCGTKTSIKFNRADKIFNFCNVSRKLLYSARKTWIAENRGSWDVTVLINKAGVIVPVGQR